MAGVESGPPALRSLSTVGLRARELTGAVDLVTYYGLQDLYDHFCKKPLPVSIADSPYLQLVVGDTEIRKGEGMELGQLISGPAPSSNQPATLPKLEKLDLQYLQWAFTLRESGPIALPEADRGQETISGNAKYENDKKHKKKHKKHKHRDKDNPKKDKDKDHAKGENDENRSKKHRKKKRKHEGAEEEGDGHKQHKKKKHKHSSKAEVPGVTKNGK